MAIDFGFIILLILGIGFGALIGFVFAKLSGKLKDKEIEKRGLEFWQGKRPNEVRLDGETINANKFVFKDYENKIQGFEIKAYVPHASKNPIQKKSLFQRLGIAK